MQSEEGSDDEEEGVSELARKISGWFVPRSSFTVHRSPFTFPRFQVQSYNTKKGMRDLVRLGEN